MKSSEIFPCNFQKYVHRKDRNRNCGGVFVTCRDHFESLSLEDSDVKRKIIWTEIQIGTKNIIVGSYYRLPRASINSLEQLNESIYKVKEKCKDKIIILGGDFNLPHIDWESSSVKLGCNQSNQHHYLLDIMEEHEL